MPAASFKSVAAMFQHRVRSTPDGDAYYYRKAGTWHTMQWREVANSLAQAMSWSAPLIPEPGDPSPYAGSAAAG